jgi:hypothetical protein
MINLILTIVILLLIIYILINKEAFYSNYLQTNEGELNPNECNYLPWGPDINSCINYCQNPSKNMKPLLENCTADKCIDKCLSCKDIDNCQWYDPNIQDLNYDITEKLPEITLNIIVDDTQSLYGTEYNPNEINIEWFNTDELNDNLDEKKYMIHYVEGPKMNNNVKIIYTNFNFFKFNLDTLEDVNNNIPVLNSDTTYLFKVYEIQPGESSKESNILQVST